MGFEPINADGYLFTMNFIRKLWNKLEVLDRSGIITCSQYTDTHIRIRVT